MDKIIPYTSEDEIIRRKMVDRLYQCLKTNYLPFEKRIIDQWEDLLPDEVKRELLGSERFLAVKGGEHVILVIRYFDKLGISKKENLGLLEIAMRLLHQISGIAQVKVWDIHGNYEEAYQLVDGKLINLLQGIEQHYEDTNNGWAD